MGRGVKALTVMCMHGHGPWDGALMGPNQRTFDVVAHRLDDGARWALKAVDVPEAHVEVIDLVDGSRTMKAVLAEHLDQPADELSINIKLA